MTTISWNCRGLAAATTISELMDICKKYKSSIIFLMETKAQRDKVEKIKRSLKFSSVFCVDPIGLSGGLCLLWRDKVNIQVRQSSPNFIHSFVSVKGGHDYECTFIYGNPIPQQRRGLWSRIAALQTSKNNAWACIGDFNEVLSHFEKDGLRPINQENACLFRQFLNDTGLMDLNLNGCKFTWASNRRNGFVTREKLDRVLVNWPWRSCYPHAIGLALPFVSSDHSPIVLQPSPNDKSGVSFKYEAFWEEHPDCRDVIRKGWVGLTEEDNPWKKYIERANSCKRELQRWHKKQFKRADEEIYKLKERLKGILNNDQHSAHWSEVQDIQNKIKELWKREEIYWFQRSRIKWMQWGDRNSKFFHASTIQRRGRNRIERIKDNDGCWVEGLDKLFRMILDHFQELYSSDSSPIEQACLQQIPHVVSDQMNADLNAPVSEMEIKEAVDSLGALKAPGPDGLNGLFFQKNWETIKGEVKRAVMDFFEKGDLPEEINETVVALIPKVPMPETLNHLRPISCCNFIYKVISKVIVCRLRKFMGDIITPNQSTFIGGRLIQDNLIVAQEVFHALKKKEGIGRDGIAIKLDMNKAYDRVEWGFLEAVLKAYGFNEKWVTTVMKLVTSVTYKYKVNGFLSSKLIPKRGLRQGDPLSPYLFIIVADVLSHMVNGSVDRGLIKGIQLVRGAPSLSHLFFADDSLFFSRADPESVYQLIGVINMYSRCFGQKINVTKSGLVCGKFVRRDLQVKLSNILGMQIWTNPGKYLGLPTEWGRAKVSSLTWIKEKVLAKLEGWKEGLLNQAGKEVLIKAVIQAIPTYAMAMVKFPKTFCKSLCSAVAHFWWCSKEKDRGIHWKSWNALTSSKGEGGMGFRDFSALNSALLAKQAWRLIK